jgi:hypothetical protein
MATAMVLPGHVIRYSYLWLEEHQRGREDGRKDRPCVVVISVKRLSEKAMRVIVVPITHMRPSDPSSAIELPQRTKLRLGLDDLPSWIIVSEGNQFDWPGPDVRPVRATGPDKYVYGLLPTDLLQKVRVQFVENFKIRPAVIPRTE